MAKKAASPAPLEPAAQQQLQQAGITDPAHQATVQRALGAGLPLVKILGWIKKFGPDIFDLLNEILESKNP